MWEEGKKNKRENNKKRRYEETRKGLKLERRKIREEDGRK
jgi:hypothetical protein